MDHAKRSGPSHMPLLDSGTRNRPVLPKVSGVTGRQSGSLKKLKMLIPESSRSGLWAGTTAQAWENEDTGPEIKARALVLV